MRHSCRGGWPVWYGISLTSGPSLFHGLLQEGPRELVGRRNATVRGSSFNCSIVSFFKRRELFFMGNVPSGFSIPYIGCVAGGGHKQGCVMSVASLYQDSVGVETSPLAGHPRVCTCLPSVGSVRLFIFSSVTPVALSECGHRYVLNSERALPAICVTGSCKSGIALDPRSHSHFINSTSLPVHRNFHAA